MRPILSGESTSTLAFRYRPPSQKADAPCRKVADVPMAETLPPIAATEQADGLLSDRKGLAVHAAGPIVG
jgi:hypothetical protein